jgi:hypothetical protein
MKARLVGFLLTCVFSAALAQDEPLTTNGAPGYPTAQPMPGVLQRTDAQGASIDLRRLPYVAPKKQEREEFEEPELNPTLLPGTEGTPSAIEQPPGGSLAPTLNAPAPAPNITFDGLDFATWGAGHPPDPNGDVGPNYYIQTVNTSIGIYDKTNGNQVAAFTFNTFMSQGHFGNLCDTSNGGDPVVLYDSFEDRWIITDFAFTSSTAGSNVFQCFAVSKTGDPVSGGWYYYSFLTNDNFPDYPKFGVWADGIYQSANLFGPGGGFVGTRVWAYNKAQLYAGAPTVQFVSFNTPDVGDFTLLPSNARLQTGTPPTGTPNYFVSVWEFLNAQTVYAFHVDWNQITLSTFGLVGTPAANSSWANVNPPNVTTPANALDSLPVRAMMQNQYTNIGGKESLWDTHTVARSALALSDVSRWYQLDVTGGTVAANDVQSTNWDPESGADTFFRWTPSIAVNRNGDVALGYSKANGTTNPQIKYAGRLANDPVNTFSQTEQTLWDGTASQLGNCGTGICIRWGDYSAMTLDPDGCTFWYVNEYYNTPNSLNDLTRIGSFSYPSCTPVGADGIVAGTVTLASDGTPLKSATVTLGSRSTTTDNSGFYAFTSLPAGTYPTMAASYPGCNTGTANSIVVADNATTTENFALTAAASSACLTDTTQSDFQTGVATNLDLTTSPGDVFLAKPTVLDQSNASVTTSGFGINATNWAGQTFRAGASGQLTKADLDLFCSGCTGTTPNLTVSIRATTGTPARPAGADLASGTIAGFSSGAAGYFTVNFAAPATVTAGTTYAIIVRPAANPSAGIYAYVCSCSSGAPGSVDTNPYANGQRVTSANSGGTWTADTTAGGRDLGFHTYINAGFASNGNLISSTKDSNPGIDSASTWTTLSWTASTPANTSVQFQVAASNALFGPFNFVGPDGTTATFFTTSGASLGQFNGFRYLKYKAYLTTTNSAVTPTLSDVTVCYVDAPLPAISMIFGQQPSNTTAGVAISPAVTVELLNVVGDVTTTDNSSQITLSVATGPSPLASGGGPVTVGSGVGTFPALVLDTAGTYTLNANSGSLPTATSSSFVVSAASASQLVFVQQPSNATAGVAIAPPITVQLEDQFGNAVSTSGVSVTLAANGPGAVTAGATASTVNGVATFNATAIQLAGTYTLTASSSGLTSANSSSFVISPAAASKLVYGQQPSNAIAGQAIAPPITVLIEDTFGNVTTSTASVALAFGTNAGGTGTVLSGGGATPAVAGTATFAAVSINHSGTGYTLVASSSGLASATSSTFNITAGIPAKLAFTTQPANNANIGAGATFNLVVQEQDSLGNLETTDNTSAVTIAIGNNPGGSTLSGTTTVTLVGGVASFSGLLTLNKPGTGYTLVATNSAGGITPATSNSFNIVPGAAAQLQFVQGPTDIVAGAIMAPPVTVKVLDSFGNQLTSSVTVVTLSITGSPAGVTLFGGGAVNDSAGIATFNALSIHKVGTYALTASSAGIPDVTSNTFVVSPGTLNSIMFSMEPPASTTAGSGFTVAVELLDQFANVITTDSTTSVSLTLAANPGGDSYAGATTTVSAGVATFNGIVINKAATGYTLQASAGGKMAISTPFDITIGSDSILNFVQQPADVPQGTPLGTVSVEILDGSGNRVTSDNTTIVSIGISTCGGSTVLGSATASSGLATFPAPASPFNLYTAATGVRLQASGGTLTAATSQSFNVTINSDFVFADGFEVCRP